MSKRKRLGAKRREGLVTLAHENGGILVNAEGGRGEGAELRRLAREGKLRRVRVRVRSDFGAHIRRTYYVPANAELTRPPSGGPAERSGA